MAKKKPAKSREDCIIEKAFTAKSLLYIHGLLSDAENVRVFERIKKRVERKQSKKASNP